MVSQAEALAASENLHAIGCLSYEAAPAFEAAASVHSAVNKKESDVVHETGLFPLAWFALYDKDNVVPCSSPSKLTALIDGGLQNNEAKPASFSVSPWTPDSTRSEYDDAISSIRTSILDGDFYQVNHTLRLRADFEGSTTMFHSRLLEAQRCGFGAFLNMDPRYITDDGKREKEETDKKNRQNSWFQVLSASPELFFHWKRSSSGELYSRPMKGTRRRGLSSSQDSSMQAELAASIKDRAENLMIVDLLRNDMSRVASKGSVRVRDLFRIEKYPTVLQMTSGVYCTPKQGTRLADVLKALFPCGSITGAPKLSAMKAIASIESSCRGPYCGMIIQIDPGEAGDISASVPIRTVVISRENVSTCSSGTTGNSDEEGDGEEKQFSPRFDCAPPGCKAEYGVGGGITWGSTASGEFDEVLSKAAVLFAASALGEAIPAQNRSEGGGGGGQSFGLFETLRYCSKSSTFLYKALHIQRLRDSCDYFKILFDEKGAEEALQRVIAENQRGEKSSEEVITDYRIRLHISHNGIASTSLTGPLDALSSSPSSLETRRCVIDSLNPVNSKSVHLYHKTTERGVYDRARASHKCHLVDDRRSPFDVLLVNEHGHLTEFCIGNLVVELSDKVGLSKESAFDDEADKEEGVRLSGGVIVEAAEHLGEDLWPQPSPGCSFYTPPISSGLLPGILRSRLIQLDKVKARIIKADEIELFQRVWLVNSVRGWVQVTLESI